MHFCISSNPHFPIIAQSFSLYLKIRSLSKSKTIGLNSIVQQTETYIIFFFFLSFSIVKDSMMITWVHITLISSFSVVIIVLILILIRKKCSKPTTPSDMVTTDAEACDEEMIKTPHQNLDSNKSSFRPRKSSSSSSSFFCWSDHPALLAHAVENGWPRFCFVPSPPLKPSDDDQSNVVISWEVFDESADYMQKMRLNPSRRDSGNLCVIRTALPLPGPQFGNAPFPKEAYFEVTILGNEYNLINGSKREKIEEEEEVKNEKDEIVMVGIGLTGGGQLPLKFPGSFAGSVGFNSTGSLFLDGELHYLPFLFFIIPLFEFLFFFQFVLKIW